MLNFDLPKFNSSGVLPPFLGDTPAERAKGSPYPVTTVAIADTLIFTPERRNIFVGFLELRTKLHQLGFVSGFQWVDGSFCEAVEVERGRPPGDIDVVTFCYRPEGKSADELVEIKNNNLDVFVPELAKKHYKCDAYLVDLTNLNPYTCVDHAKYWFGLFSHRRETFLWKGMLRVELGTVADDIKARAMCI